MFHLNVNLQEIKINNSTFCCFSVVRVQSNGHVVVKFEVVIKDMKKLGFVTSQKVIREES